MIEIQFVILTKTHFNFFDIKDTYEDKYSFSEETDFL